jgi:uncharacterized protein (DUF486 family)
VLYFFIGIASIALADRAGSTQMRDTWRVLSFLTSGLAFAVHIGYEHFRLGNSPRITATHASLAVALGAFALAVSANVHGQWVHSSQRRLLALALLAWPVLTGVPAFVVALVAAAVLGLRRRT